MTWRESAQCYDLPPGTMYPEDEADERRVARTHCKDCPVIDPCLREAMALPEKWGVWGGLSSKERRTLARRRIA